MKPLDVFFEYNGEGISYAKVTPETCDKYRLIFPKYLIDLWKKRGFLHLKERFFWFVNPDEYAALYALLNPQNANTFVVMRTGLGGLFIFQNEVFDSKKRTKQEGKYYYYCPIFNQTTYLADTFKDVLNGWLTTKEVYEPLTLWPIYKQAVQMLPKIESNQCYGFVPAIALGGDLDTENLKVVNIKTYLSFLSQLQK